MIFFPLKNISSNNYYLITEEILEYFLVLADGSVVAEASVLILEDDSELTIKDGCILES